MQSLAALNTGDVRLDAPMDPEGDRSLIERFVADEMPDTEEEAMNRFLTDEIEQALTTLPPRDAKVLRLYFGLEGGREHTLEEIGSMLGVTRERVRQLRDRALKRLREGDVGRALGQLRRLSVQTAAACRVTSGGGRWFAALPSLLVFSAHHALTFALPAPRICPRCHDRTQRRPQGLRPQRVLAGFSLAVNEGETMVIIGFSGTGKSVAIKHIVGLLEPDAGEREGRRAGSADSSRARSSTALRAKIGYVFQFAALFDSLTVGENVAMGLRKQGTDRSEIAARVAEALDLVDLPGLDDAHSRRTVRRHAQARRHRARHRAAPEVHPVRRADHGSRSRHQRRRSTS